MAREVIILLELVDMPSDFQQRVYSYPSLPYWQIDSTPILWLSEYALTLLYSTKNM